MRKYRYKDWLAKIGLGLVILTASCQAQMLELQIAFEEKMGGITVSHETKTLDLRMKYADALEQLLNTVKEDGDLDAALAVIEALPSTLLGAS